MEKTLKTIGTKGSHLFYMKWQLMKPLQCKSNAVINCPRQKRGGGGGVGGGEGWQKNSSGKVSIVMAKTLKKSALNGLTFFYMQWQLM